MHQLPLHPEGYDVFLHLIKLLSQKQYPLLIESHHQDLADQYLT
jgi:hypothetical protein